ncbi:MAG: hypothetical protein ACW96M_05785, partial [Candidatus Thorarchaeota archaeon]
MGSNEFRARDIASVTGLIAVLGPAFILFSSPSWIVVSMMWQVVFELTIIPLFDPMRLLLVFPLTFMRFAVPIIMTRLYQNRTTARRALMIIIASEIQPIILYDIPLFLFAIYQGITF